MNPWHVLGIAPTEDARAIKQAYARALKQTRPDSDPEGYQRLRECYEWALEWAQQYSNPPQHPIEPVDSSDSSARAPELRGEDYETACQKADLTAELIDPADLRQSDPPGVAPLQGVGEEEGQALIPIVDPEALLSSLHDYWQREGEAALIAAVPRLIFMLDEVPLTLRAEACYRFASWVVQERLPLEVVEALQQHFEWGRDFRVERLLGGELSLALRARLQEMHLDRPTTGRQRTQRVLFKDFKERVNSGRAWQARWRLLRESGREVANLISQIWEIQSRPATRNTVSKHAGEIAERSEHLLAMAFAALTAMLVTLIEARIAAPAGAVLAIGLYAAAMAALLSSALLMRSMDALSRILQSLAGSAARVGYGRLFVALGLCAAAALWGSSSPAPWLSLAASAFVLQLLWWQTCRWRMLLLPLSIQFALALAPLLPSSWPPWSSWWIALGWVSISHFELLRAGTYSRIFSDPRALVPQRAIEVVWYLIAFKVVLLILAVAYILLLPTTHLVQSLRDAPHRSAAWSGMTILLLFIARGDPVLCASIALLSPLLFFLLTRGTRALAARLTLPAAAS